MDTVSRIGLWFSRILLFGAGALFVLISLRYLIHPVSATGKFDISLGTATAITNIRIGFGAFPLSFAVVLLVCLFKTKRLQTGLYFLGAVISIVTIVRVIGVLMDGATSETMQVLRPEIVLFCLTIVGIILERRRRQLSDPAFEK